MSASTLAGAALGVQAAATTSAAGACLYGVLCLGRSMLGLSVHPADLEPWILFVGNTIWTSANGALLIYHLISKARRDESKAWKAISRPLRRKPKPRQS